jgi:hypothetical protein
VINEVLDLRRNADVAVLVEEANRLKASVDMMKLGDRFPYLVNAITSTAQTLHFGASLIKGGMLPGGLVQPGSWDEPDEDVAPNEEPPRA